MINALDLDYKQLKRTRRVNGERVIELTVFPTEENKNYFDLLVEEAIVTFDSDEYVIKKVTEKSIGNTYFKQITAIHKFYVDLINKQQYDVHNGSITFQNYMNFVFEDTPYANFETIDNFHAREFENLGDDNRLALLQKGLDRFKAEMELVGSGYKPRFRKMIGRDTDFQFRFGHNIKAISRDIDTTNLATYIRGYGDPELDVFAEYTSPNATIFGVIDAPTVRDERFKSNKAMLDEIKSRLVDEPEVSITIDFVDLRRAGYPFTVPNEGDRVWIIYEPMDDLMIETRILEIEEEFNKNMEVIKTTVTLSNHKKSFAGTVFDKIQKQLSDIVDDDGIIRYNVLDEAVKIATEALQSAQTQLEFNNGIIAREKDDPNRLVVFNSAGIGISKDGGQTFTEAITADGFVLSAGAVGRLSANHVQIGPETLWSEPESENLAIGTDEARTNENTELGLLYALDITPKGLKIGDKFVLEFDAYVFNEDLMIGIATHGFDPVANDYIAPPVTINTSGRHTFEITVSNIPDGDNLFLISENAYLVDVFEISNLTLKKVGETVPEWLDNKLLTDLRLETPLPTSIRMNQDGITAYTTQDPNSYARLDHRGLYIKGGAIQIDGGLSDDQIKSADKWNRQGTYIDSNGVYTGLISADQIEVAFNNVTNQVQIDSHDGLLLMYDGLELATLNGFGINFYNGLNRHVGGILRSDVDYVQYAGINTRLNAQGDFISWSDRSGNHVLAYYENSNVAGYKGIVHRSNTLFQGNVRVDPNNVFENTYFRTPDSSGRILSFKNESWEGIAGVAIRRDPNRDRGEGGIFIASSRVALTVPQTQGSSTHTALEVTRNYVRSVAIYNQTTSSAANVYISSSANLLRSTSSSKYKLVIENEEEKGYDYKRILNLNVKSWYDKTAVETYAEVLNGNLAEADVDALPITRHFGLIAEDVYDAGLTEFVTYGKNKEVEGIEYDRLWTLLIPISREHEQRLNEYDNRFGTIENRIENIENELAQLKGV